MKEDMVMMVYEPETHGLVFKWLTSCHPLLIPRRFLILKSELRMCFRILLNTVLLVSHSQVNLQLLLLLLRHFSRVWLCVTPETAAHQSPLSLGFSRQEHWSGLPFPSPMHESEKWKWSRSVVTLGDPMDCSLPGSSTHGIFQARVLEWGAIASFPL